MADTKTNRDYLTLQKLAALLQSFGNATGKIGLHPSLYSAIAEILKEGQTLPERSLASLVQVLDDTGLCICSRLEVNAFVSLFAIFRVVEPCWMQQRGLCLLSEGLDDFEWTVDGTQTSVSTSVNRPLFSRKAFIGSEILRESLKYFCDTTAEDGTRRWMGLIALALLQDCNENVQLITKDREERRYMLGQMVIEDSNEQLRFIAGSIIRQLVGCGISEELFWPKSNDLAPRADFFKSQLDNPQWLELFEGYLDEIDSQMETHAQKCAPFSYVLHLGDNIYNDPMPSFLVTLHRLVSIVIPEFTSSTGKKMAAQYVDIPLENIGEVDIVESTVETSTSSAEGYIRFAVLLHLIQRDHGTLFVNAATRLYHSVQLAFDDGDVARTLKALILEHRIKNKPIRLASDPVYNALRIPNDEPTPGGSHMMFSTYNTRSTQNQTVNATTKPLVRGSVGLGPHLTSNVELISRGAADNNSLHTLVPTTVSVNGIPDRNRSLDTMPQLKQMPVLRRSGNSVMRSVKASTAAVFSESDFHENPLERPMKGFEEEFSRTPVPEQTKHYLDTIPRSSKEWLDGARAIENAPELSNRPHEADLIDGLQSMPNGRQELSGSVGQTGAPLTKGLAIMPREQHQKVSSTAATDLRAISEQLVVSANLRNQGASKISGRMLTVESKSIIQGISVSGSSRAKKHVETAIAASGNGGYSSAKKRITYNSASKRSKQANQTHDGTESANREEDNDVYEIPTSPNRSSRPRAKQRSKKPPAKASRSARSKNASKASKVKQGLDGLRNQFSKKATASKSTRANVGRGDILGTDEDGEFDDGGHLEDKDGAEAITKGEEEHEVAERNSISNSGLLPSITKAANSDEVLIPSVKSKPRVTKKNGTKPTATTRSLKPESATLSHPSTRRAAAIKANNKIQGLIVDAVSAEANNPVEILENAEDILGKDGPKQKFEQSAPPDKVVFAIEAHLNVERADKKNSQNQKSKQRASKTQRNAERPGEASGNHNNDTEDLSNVLSTPQGVELHVEEADRSFRDDEQNCSASELLPIEGGPLSPGEQLDLINTGMLSGLQQDYSANSLDDAMTFRAGDGSEGILANTFVGLETQAQGTNLESGIQKHIVLSTQTPDLPANNHADIQQPLFGIDQASNIMPTAIMVPQQVLLDTVLGPNANIPWPNTISKTLQSSNTEHAGTAKLSSTVENVPRLGHPLSSISQANTRKLIEAQSGGQVSARVNAVNKGPHQPEIDASKDEDRSQIKQDLDRTIAHQVTLDAIHVSSEGAVSSGDVSERARTKVKEVNNHRSQVSGKRKSADGLANPLKKIKVSAPELHAILGKVHTEDAYGAEALELVDLVATDNYIQRKAILIGFNSKGPRNQGVVSPKKSIPNADHELAVDPILWDTQSFSTKRKHSEDRTKAKSSSNLELAMEAPIEKRRKIVDMVPPTPVNDTSELARSSSPSLPPVTRLLGPQGSRVQDNGSPVATVDQIRRVSGVDMQNLFQRLGNDGKGNTLSIEDSIAGGEEKSTQVDMWTLHGSPPPQRLKYQRPSGDFERPSSSRMKLQPSSPTAPSRMLADMAAHHIQPDGHFVDVRTANVIQIAEPPDPFTGQDLKVSNSFIEMLRASTANGGSSKQQEAQEPELSLSGDVGKHASRVDPDRTLVDVGKPRRSRRSPPSEGDPSSSHSFRSKDSKDLVMPSDSEENEKREEQAREWMEALRPYQKRTLITLQGMSNRLMDHLLDKESAVQSVLKDYSEGGNKLLDELRRAHGDDRKVYGHKVGLIKQSLTATYGNLKAKFGKELKGVKKQSVREVQMTWKDGKQTAQKQLAAALSAYSEV